MSSKLSATISLRHVFLGESGRVYVQGEVLQRHREDHNLSIFKAESENKSFAVKRVLRPFYNLFFRLAAELTGSHIKLDNILLNWTCDNEGNEIVTDVALGDFDIACKLEDGQALETWYAIGNVMWRSPEGQTGTGVTKALDIFSFGLVCIYTLGGGLFLLLNDSWELITQGIRLEQAILIRHLSYFGLAPEGLFMQVSNEKWRYALRVGAKAAEQIVNNDFELRFTEWGVDFGPEAQNMISGMTNLDPTARTTINQVLSYRWWQDD
ncbi:kinase-like domain-containing protein [Xylaria castorea]|nr:kinase-like domain-containing protein [Xylaria castorea]